MNKHKSLLEVHSAVLFFGLAGLFGKWLSISPLTIVFGRVFFASAVLALFLWFSKQNFKISPARNYASIGFVFLNQFRYPRLRLAFYPSQLIQSSQPFLNLFSSKKR